MTEPDSQDLEHLKLLSVFHYVVALFAALFSLFPLIHMTVGIGLLSGLFPDDGDPVVKTVGTIFVVVAATVMLAGFTCSALIAFAGWNLAKRTRYTFCLVIGGVECLFLPFGTVLGIVTIVVLAKASVKDLFESPALV